MYNRKEIIKVFRSSKSMKEVSHKLGVSIMACHLLVFRMRREGHRIEKFDSHKTDEKAKRFMAIFNKCSSNKEASEKLGLTIKKTYVLACFYRAHGHRIKYFSKSPSRTFEMTDNFKMELPPDSKKDLSLDNRRTIFDL